MTTVARDRWNVITKEASASKRAAGIGTRLSGDPLKADQVKAHQRAMRHEDPRDTTGRFFDDPLPGRSALDRKRAGEGHADG